MMGPVSIDPEVGRLHLTQALRTGGASLGLRGEVHVEWTYNPGNFQNASFRVSDGTRDLHVKLVEDPTRPDVWFRLQERLAREYRAPEILARLELPHAGLVAYVFPRLRGRALDPRRDGAVLREVGSLVGRLHRDDDLAAELSSGSVPTSWSTFRTGIFECLSEDLRFVRAHPGVSGTLDASTIAWLAEEVEAIHAEARRRIPDDEVRSPLHGDLWSANVLVHEDGWHLLDWDEMRLGDPAGDWATLLFDVGAHGVRPDDLLPADPEMRRRVATWLRAGAFDAIVDPLADLTTMTPGIPHADRIRAEKHAASDAALLRYRALYPASS
jgi:aminoglycoside phosphotransferase (APT) family kinase protein